MRTVPRDRPGSAPASAVGGASGSFRRRASPSADRRGGRHEEAGCHDWRPEARRPRTPALAPGHRRRRSHSDCARRDAVGVTALDKARAKEQRARDRPPPPVVPLRARPRRAAAASSHGCLSDVRHSGTSCGCRARPALAGTALRVGRASRAAHQRARVAACRPPPSWATASSRWHGQPPKALQPVPMLVTGAAAPQTGLRSSDPPRVGRPLALDNDARRPPRIAEAAGWLELTLAGVQAWARRLGTWSAGSAGVSPWA